jgi:hypothetical protein
MPTVPSEKGANSPRHWTARGAGSKSRPPHEGCRSTDGTQDRHRGSHAASDPAQAAERLATHGVSQPRVDRSAADGRARPERRAAVLGGGPRRLGGCPLATPAIGAWRGCDRTKLDLEVGRVSTSSRTPKYLELSAQDNVGKQNREHDGSPPAPRSDQLRPDPRLCQPPFSAISTSASFGPQPPRS